MGSNLAKLRATGGNDLKNIEQMGVNLLKKSEQHRMSAREVLKRREKEALGQDNTRKISIEEAQSKNEELVKNSQALMEQVEIKIERQVITPKLKDGEVRPLPKDKSMVVKDYWKRKYEGLLTPDQVLEFYSLRVNSPGQWSIFKLAAKFNISVELTENMLKYYASPVKVIMDGKKCAVWPAEAREMVVLQKVMKNAFGSEPDVEVTKAELIAYRTELEWMKQKEVLEREKKKKEMDGGQQLGEKKI